MTLCVSATIQIIPPSKPTPGPGRIIAKPYITPIFEFCLVCLSFAKMNLARAYVWLEASDCISFQRLRSTPFTNSQRARMAIAAIMGRMM